MALSSYDLNARRRAISGTLATTVLLVTVRGWSEVDIVVTGDRAHAVVVDGDATLEALAAGDAAPSGYSTSGIAAGAGYTVKGPHLGPWKIALWGASTSSAVDLRPVR